MSDRLRRVTRGGAFLDPGVADEIERLNAEWADDAAADWTGELQVRLADPRWHGADRAGEPTGDPTPCELGDHPDTEGGRCLLCGEWVLSYPDGR